MDEVELGRGEANYYTSMKSHLSLALEQLHVAYSGLYSINVAWATKNISSSSDPLPTQLIAYGPADNPVSSWTVLNTTISAKVGAYYKHYIDLQSFYYLSVVENSKLTVKTYGNLGSNRKSVESRYNKTRR